LVMKELIHKSKFVEVFFDAETKIYESKYFGETRDMTDQEWREQMFEIKALIEKCKPSYIIDDNRNRLYSYSPDIQVWTLELFVDSWNSLGLKKYAQIMPMDIIGKLTADQIEEFAVKDFEMHYQHKLVDDYKSAYDWIIDVN